MKSVFSLIAMVMLSTSFSAAADLCDADYQGSWSGRPLHISVTRTFRNQVNVILSQHGSSENLRGTCDYEHGGSATLSFRGRYNEGHLGISRDGYISGFISNYAFDGQIVGGFPVPGPGPIPGPGPGPGPGPDYNHCYGTIQGVWGYKDGRAMTLTVQRGSGEQVIVIVTQANGAEQTNGICRPQWDGSAQVEFQGTFNSGNITIDTSNRVSGIVSNYSFQGQKN